MEDGLILKPKDNGFTWRVMAEEMKKLGLIAAPMMAVTLSQLLVQFITVTMVGHLGELALSSTSIAISLSSVTGFSLIMGMSSALETLCGQAYGAKQYTKVGVQTYTAIFSLLLVCIPLAILWRYTGPLLLLMGQSPSISHEAGNFTTCLIPALFAYAILQPLVRYFQMQSMLLPVLASSVAALCLHIPLCWALEYKTGLGNIGAALSMGVSLWSNAIFLLFYMMYSPSCAKTRAPVSVEVFYGMKQFFSFAIPSAVMICLQWWSNEFLILLSGFLPNPELETSVLSVCLNTIITLYAIPYGFAAGVSTRASNELGAGNARGARVAVNAIIILAVVETTIVSMIVFVNRRVFGYIFTNEKEVVDYATKIAPFLCVNIIMDGLQGTFSGVARGVGWQHIGAYTNLVAFYLVGIPVAVVLGFCTSLRGEGLWIGILVGAIIQVILLSVVTFCTNYEKQVLQIPDMAMVTSLVSESERPVVIFSKSSCCVCHTIKKLITNFGANPRVYELDEHPNGKQLEKELIRGLGCKPSVPAVFIGEELIGGANEILSLHLKGQLVQLLLQANAIWF